MGQPRQDAGAIIQRITARLAPELSGILSAQSVERAVAECYVAVSDQATVTEFLDVLVERAAHDRLSAVVCSDLSVQRDVPEVLFVCVHNAGRSQMAAAILAHLAAGDVRSRSAGTQPADQVNPVVVEALEEWGIDITREVPKKLTDEAVLSADVVICMGCGDACGVYPGKRYLEWPLEDPAGKTLEEVRRIRDEIRMEVEALLDELVPIAA